MTREVCPCCHRALPTVRAKSPGEKKYREDVAKAERAIAILDRTCPFPDMSFTSRLEYLRSRYVHTNSGFVRRVDTAEAFMDAVEIEAARMRRALTDPKLLWSIYRRADKAEGYGEEVTGPQA